MICDEIILPEAIRRATASIHGLRGLPLPKRKSSRTTETIEAPVQVAKVTPTVIGATYSINGVDVKRGSNNRQAVAEFQEGPINGLYLSVIRGRELVARRHFVAVEQQLPWALGRWLLGII